jgi:Protein of unknown function (DUF2934)
MAQKKPTKDMKTAPAAKPAAKAAATTEVRNSAVPPRSATAPAKKEIGYEQIAKKAYELWQSNGGSEMDNWLKAERELRGK